MHLVYARKSDLAGKSCSLWSVFVKKALIERSFLVRAFAMDGDNKGRWRIAGLGTIRRCGGTVASFQLSSQLVLIIRERWRAG